MRWKHIRTNGMKARPHPSAPGRPYGGSRALGGGGSLVRNPFFRAGLPDGRGQPDSAIPGFLPR